MGHAWLSDRDGNVMTHTVSTPLTPIPLGGYSRQDGGEQCRKCPGIICYFFDDYEIYGALPTRLLSAVVVTQTVVGGVVAYFG